MIEPTLIAQIEALPVAQATRVGDTVFTSHDRAVINTVYVGLFGKNVKRCSCKHRFTDAVIEIMAALKLTTMKKSRNYELKAGALIWVNNNPYSNANLTDKVAKEWCKAHADEIDQYFQRYPIIEEVTEEATEKEEVDEIEQEVTEE